MARRGRVARFGLFAAAAVAWGTVRGTSPGVAEGILWGWLVYVTGVELRPRRAYELRIVEDELEVASAARPDG